MAKGKIGALIALDGEKEFKQAVTDCNKSLVTLKSEIALVQAESEGQANSLEALQKKHAVLTKVLEEQGKKQEAVSEGLEHAKQSYEKIGTGLDDLKSKLSNATDALEEMKKTSSATDEELKAQEKTVKELSDAVAKGENNYKTAGDRVQDWEAKLNTAKTQVVKTNSELNKNAAYMREAEQAADRCATSIDEFGKRTKQSAKEIEAAGEKTSTFGSVLKANLTSEAIISGVKKLGDVVKEAAKYAVEVGSSFEAGMSKVAAISGATGEDLDKLEEKAKELGSSTKFSASEAADAMSYMAMAGWKTGDMLDGISGIMNLAAASGEDLAATSDIVTDALTAFGMKANESEKFADILAAASSNANTNVSMMGESFKHVAPLCGSLGYSAEDAAVALGLMANSGIKSSQAGTALRAALTNMVEPTDKMAIKMEEYGISVKNSDGTMKSLSEVMDMLRENLGGLSEAEQTSAAATIFGKEAMSGMLSIINAAPEDYNKLTKAIESSDGAAQKMADTMQDNLSGKVTEMESALEGLGIAAYGYISGPLQWVVEGITDIISGMTASLTPQKSVLDSFVDEIEASNREVNTLLNNSKTTMSNAEADAAKFDTYKDSLIELNGVTEKTEYQKFQMKTIVGELASSVPELAAAFDEETSSINLTDQEIRNLMESHKQYALQEASIKAQTDAMTALFDAELNAAKAASAVKEAQKQIGDIESQDNFEELLGMNDDLLNQYRDANGVLKDAKDAEEEATEAVKEAQEQYSYTSEAVEAASESVAKYTGATEESTKAAQDNEEALEAQAAEEERLRQEQELRAQATADATAQIVEDVQSQISIFSKATNLQGEELRTATEETLANMESQATAMKNWATNLQAISEMGINKGLLQYLADMGPSGAEYVAQFAAMTDTQLQQANEAWSKTMEQSEIGAKLAGELSGEIDEITNELMEKGKDLGLNYTEGTEEGITEGKGAVIDAAKDTADSIATSSEEVLGVQSPSKRMQEIGGYASTGLANGIIGRIIDVISNSRIVARSAITATSQLMTPATFYKFGLNVSSGLAQGILDGQSEVVNAVAAMCESATEQARKSLDINSPSKVFEELGSYSAQGYGVGFQDQMKYVQAAVNDSMRFSAAAGQGTEQSSMTSRDMTDLIENALYNGVMNAMSRVKIENNLGNLQVNVRFGTDNMVEVLQDADSQFRARNGRGMFERG